MCNCASQHSHARAHTHTQTHKHKQYLMEEKKRTAGMPAAPPPWLDARLPQQAPIRGRREEHDGRTAGVVVGGRAVENSFRSGKRCFCATAFLSI